MNPKTDQAAVDAPVPNKLVPFDSQCLMFIVPLLAVGGLGYAMGWVWLWAPVAALIFCVAMFFRDPNRKIPNVPGAIVSPADGKVTNIDANTDPEKGPVPGTRVSIFLSVLNVHINRAPAAGSILRIRYQPGKFVNAMDENCGDANECNWIYMRVGPYDMTMRQIAGLIARRIVCRVREGQGVARGERVGLIRFGSRTELFLPPEAKVKVKVGQKVRGAADIIAILETPDPAASKG